MNAEDTFTLDDDIASMKSHLNIPAWRYLDVAAQDELKLALARWPLLAELSRP